MKIEASGIHWDQCNGCRDNYKPVGPKFCCVNCYEATTKSYVLDTHTALCRDRQRDFLKEMTKRDLMGDNPPGITY